MKHLFPLSALLSLLILSCAKKDPNPEAEPLSLKKIPYNGPLHMDGYYYNSLDTEFQSFVGILYRNGVLFEDGLYGGSLRYIDSQLVRTRQISAGRHRWGLFAIEDSVITTEVWGYTEGNAPRPLQCRKGVVLNDSTFVLQDSWSRLKGLESPVYYYEDTFHFRRFAPKPDSTNPYTQ